MKIAEISVGINWLDEEKVKKCNELFNESIFQKADLEYFIKKAQSYSSKRTEEHIKEGNERYSNRKGNYVNYGSEEEYGFKGNKVTVDLDTIFTKLPFIKNITIERIIPIELNNSLGVTSAMLDALSKFEDLNNDINNLIERTRKFNDKCDVHIGGGLLMRVREVKVCEDYCTEQLQRELDEGWVIVAVCVQPDGRRPDYVLGKYKDN